MTQQEWEPGTVALVNGETKPRVLDADGDWFRSGASYVFSYESPKVRPLLVLDPDNPDQMRELCEAARLTAPCWPDDIAAAVRAMLPKPTPVKPAEPTGLGAVVEDSEGKWVCLDNSRLPWREWTSGEFRDWADFSNAVKVLSEGVTP